MLERFAAEQKTDRDPTIRLTDVMAHGFVLGLFGVVCPAKKLLAEQRMLGRR